MDMFFFRAACRRESWGVWKEMVVGRCAVVADMMKEGRRGNLLFFKSCGLVCFARVGARRESRQQRPVPGLVAGMVGCA
jgi:hypothetical protein